MKNIFITLSLIGLCTLAWAQTNDQPSAMQTDEMIYKEIFEAYLFGYTLVTTEVYGLASTNVVMAGYDGAPINQIKLAKSVRSDAMTEGPNLETAYGKALLDLRAEPLILTKPQAEPERYFGLLLTSARGAVIDLLGTQGLGGNAAATYALVGPDYRGPLPEGVTIVPCPTNLVTVMIRIREFDTRENDFATLDALQRSIDLRPLSAYGNATYVNPDGIYHPEYEYVPYFKNNSLTLLEFFERYNRLSAYNPVEEPHQATADRFEKYNIGAGKVFTLALFNAELAERLNKIPQTFTEHFDEYVSRISHLQDGWETVAGDALKVGGSFLLRANYAHWGVGVNPPEVFKGYGTKTDGNGEVLNGKNSYRIRFKKNALPPFKEGGFWSIVLYYGPRLSVPENAIKRYKINDLSALSVNKDGTVDIYFQPGDPGGKKTSNWLPTVAGEFQFVLRIYAPQDQAVNGNWEPPQLERVK